MIEEYSSSDEMITTSNIQINPFNLSTDTARVNISVCPNHFIHFKVGKILYCYNWRVSEASELLSGLNNEYQIYMLFICIYGM